MGEEGGFYFSREVIGDTLLDNQVWMVLRLCLAPLSTGASPSCLSREFVRYDAENKMLLHRGSLSDGTPIVEWWRDAPCRLDANFNAFVECVGPGAEGHPYNTYGGYDYTLSLPPDEIEGVTAKGFVTGGTEATTEVVAGFGPVYYSAEASLDHDVLVWARVGGEEYGGAAFAFPTANEPGVSPTHTVGIAAVYPNPVRERLTVAFHLAKPGPVAIEVVDVLGRVVAQSEGHTYGLGEHTLVIDVARLPSGVYFVRLGTGGERAVRSFVVTK